MDKQNRILTKFSRRWYFIFLLICILIGVILGFIYDVWNDGAFWYDLITTIICTAITICVYTLTYDWLVKDLSSQVIIDQINKELNVAQKQIKNEFRREVDNSIVKSLGAELDIIQKYEDKEVVDVVNNCSKRLLGEILSRRMKSFLESVLENPSYRADMDYRIDIVPNEMGSSINQIDKYVQCKDSQFCISQTLEYIKYLKKPHGENYELKDLKFSCYFSFNENPFSQKEHRVQKEIFFLREELSSLSFSEMLNKENAISLLDYSVTFLCKDKEGETERRVMVDRGSITVSIEGTDVRRKRLKFTCDIPNDVLKEEQEYVFFNAEVRCSYPTTRREFYFKVPELTNEAKVKILLKSSKEELHLVSFTDNYRIVSKNYNESDFRPKRVDNRILLPNNGFTAVW